MDRLTANQEVFYLKDLGSRGIILARVRITQVIPRDRGTFYSFQILEPIEGVIEQAHIPCSRGFFTLLDQLQEGILKIFEARKAESKHTQTICRINNQDRREQIARADNEIARMESIMDRDATLCGEFLARLDCRLHP